MAAPSSGEEEKLKIFLFESAMTGRWDHILEKYKTNSKARRAQLTKSKDTAVHIAIATGKSEIAQKLLDVIYDEFEEEILKDVVNSDGNTPLHVAAIYGDLDVCDKIVRMNPRVVLVRNSNGETPLFLAASHGREKTFFTLHSHFPQEQLLRREDGVTVLHIAITHEYFALKVIEAHPNIADSLNEDGESPLHLLANKPNAFKRSTPLGLFDRIIYYSQVVDIEDTATLIAEEEDSENKKDIKNYPANYKTCMNFIIQLKHVFEMFFEGRKKDDENVEHHESTNFVRQLKRVLVKGRKDDDKVDEENTPQLATLAEPDSSGAGAPFSSPVGFEPMPDLPPQTTMERTTSSLGFDSRNEEILKEKKFLPPNYDTWVLFLKFTMKVLLVILGIGIWRMNKIKKLKQKHILANLIMNKLVKLSMMSYADGSDPELNTEQVTEVTEAIQRPEGPETNSQKKPIRSPILIAAKAGVLEIVEKILADYPVAIQDVDWNKKNVVLLAVENRQPHVYDFLLKKKKVLPKENIFRQVDEQGNNVLHLAATQCQDQRPWLIPGSALQMQWEIKWYEFVKNSMPPNFFAMTYNHDEKTPKELFIETHKDLIKDGSEWLSKTSESCSVVAALVATVAFATSSAVPGGVREQGMPTLEQEPAFNAFAISSLVALCFSVTALVFFLSILTSRYQEKDFANDLPRKLLLGLTTLFASIASMLVSFCAGHVFVLRNELRFVAYPLYAALCLPITFFAFAQLSLYFDLIMAIFKKVPQRNYEVFQD